MQDLLIGLDSDLQAELLNVTVNDPLVVAYPIKPSYQITFLKFVISQLEEQEAELNDALYEKYCDLMHQGPGGPNYFKHYEYGEGDVISLIESSSFISDGTTGLCSWQASKGLCEWASDNVKELEGKRILELGSGCGLLGIFIARICDPSMIIMSDYHDAVLRVLAENIDINFNMCQTVEAKNPWTNVYILLQKNEKSTIGAMNLDWEFAAESQLEQLIEPDVIIGADIVYDNRLFPALLATLNYVFELRRNECKFVLSCTERNPNTLKEFLDLLSK